ncbi:MAG TPA: hypothetical protein VFF52_21140 [Isosphaeraceae bacterium]|nr:hypothetical protein [Isosphaeraceae bacterium]
MDEARSPPSASRSDAAGPPHDPGGPRFHTLVSTPLLAALDGESRSEIIVSVGDGTVSVLGCRR